MGKYLTIFMSFYLTFQYSLKNIILVDFTKFLLVHQKKRALEYRTSLSLCGCMYVEVFYTF